MEIHCDGPAELGVQALTGSVRRELATPGGELERHRVEARPRQAGEDLGEDPGQIAEPASRTVCDV